MRHLLVNKFKNSLLMRLGGMFFAITLLAVASMSTSWMVAETTQGSGKAINIAGSLRMQSWRMASLYHRLQHEDRPENRAVLQQSMNLFEQSLKAESILAILPTDKTAALNRNYSLITEQWHTRIRPALSRPPEASPDAVLALIPDFVNHIDALVKQVEEAAEAKILVLRVILGVSVIATLLVAALSIYLVNNILVHPLRRLLGLTDDIRQGNLDVRSNLGGENEIGRLGQAFDLMAEDLSKLYQNMEQRVTEKTAELTIANRSLELLYHSISRLYSGPVAPGTYAILLRDLENVLGIGHGLACLVETGNERGQVIATTLDPGSGDVDVCGLMSCAQCMASREIAIHGLAGGARVLTMPLKDAEQHYGVLQLEVPDQRELEPWQSQLLEALSRHIGIAIGTARRSEQSRRLSLLEERAALARELHDSLAQSLAYMKIQVSRLKPHIEGREDVASEILNELRDGLNSAYRQLRELLTTFRLRIAGEGLGAALQSTVAEFSARGDIRILLDTSLGGCPLSANEEIHALQIVREALSNVLNHARASQAKVSLGCEPDGRVIVVVEDNGIGVRKMAAAHHYGMTIMEERAKHLGGSVSIDPVEPSGTRVTLRFVPVSRREGATLHREPEA